MPKKYSRVSAYHRVINGKQVWIVFFIRKNSKYKEIKMQNGQDTSPEQTEVRGDGRKELRPSHINVNIREAESHFLVSFNHGQTRVFHNVEEILVAVEVEVKRLGGTLGG